MISIKYKIQLNDIYAITISQIEKKKLKTKENKTNQIRILDSHNQRR